MELKTGDILHCTGTGFIAESIMRLTKSEFSHTAIFIRVWGQDYIIDAQNDGVNLRPFSAWMEKYQYQFIVTRAPNIDERTFALKALTKVGVTAYDFASLLFRQPWSLLTGKWKTERKDSTRKMYCSEYVAWCHNFDSYFRMNPKDVYNKCLHYNHEIIK